MHIPLCVIVIVILLQIRHSLAIGFLVNLAVAVEGLATFFVTGEWTDQVRVLNLVGILCEDSNVVLLGGVHNFIPINRDLSKATIWPVTKNVRLFCIFAEVFSKGCRYLVRKPIGRDNKHRGH